ncbi:hypothetical protein FGO68_gene14632 [Halteria grandinella]|uniref:Uncharacterized protein n=1 Tax=Halteria grandinella TaxID=5974 RepID=A0A8J8NIW2_HALGN|nr:hypothetical protein FGO68_gene14632 [Halteria grandinella]
MSVAHFLTQHIRTTAQENPRMSYEIRRSIAVTLLASFAMVGCNSEKGVGVASTAEAEADAKAAADSKDANQRPQGARPKIKASGSADSLKLEQLILTSIINQSRPGIFQLRLPGRSRSR